MSFVIKFNIISNELIQSPEKLITSDSVTCVLNCLKVNTSAINNAITNNPKTKGITFRDLLKNSEIIAQYDITKDTGNVWYIILYNAL